MVEFALVLVVVWKGASAGRALWFEVYPVFEARFVEDVSARCLVDVLKLLEQRG